jgi:hypothetical protein
MATLDGYLTEIAALLHDQTFSFTSQSQLTVWINSARYEAAERSGCIRRFLSAQSAWGASAQPGSIIPGGMQPGALPGAGPSTQNAAISLSLQTIPGLERYPYQGFFNPVLREMHAGVECILDTISVSVAWGTGSTKPQLRWMPWEDFQAYLRSLNTPINDYPAAWTVYNDGEFGEIWLGPPPNSAGDMELDVFCAPKDLVTNSDFEALPRTAAKAIKWGAAKLAFMTKEKWVQAQLMENEFAKELGVRAVAVDGGKAGAAYAVSRF